MSKLRWFRLYDSILTSPKVQLLPLEVRWRWIEALCVASQNSERGYLPCLEHVAFYFKLSIEDTDAVLKVLIDAGLIDKVPGSKKLQMHDWDERQFSSDDSYARVKRFRERKRNVSSAVTETLQKRNSTQARGTDSDTDTDTEAAAPQTPLLEIAAPLPQNIAAPLPENKEPTEHPGCHGHAEPPEYPEEPNSMFMIMPGDHKHSELEARKLWGKMWRAWKNCKLCFQFYEHQQWISVAGWEYAIKTVIKRGVIPNSIQYLEKIGVDADVNGIRTDRPIQRGQIGNVPYVPTDEQNGNGQMTNMPYSALNPPPDLEQYNTQEYRDLKAKDEARLLERERIRRERADQRGKRKG